jgi:hypothetical protein
LRQRALDPPGLVQMAVTRTPTSVAEIALRLAPQPRRTARPPA